MDYYLAATLDISFDAAVAATKDVLKRHHFRVLSEINMKDNFKKALDIEFRPYLIIGTCKPELTYRALVAEDKIGTMLPCNIVVQQLSDGRVEVAAVDPLVSMTVSGHVVVSQVAQEIRSALQKVVGEVRQRT